MELDGITLLLCTFLLSIPLWLILGELAELNKHIKSEIQEVKNEHS